MPTIIDPDSLNDSVADDASTEVFINTATKRVKLNGGVGNLQNTGLQGDNGVTKKALYSFLKEEWTNDPHSKNLAAFPFPLVPITDESFEWVDGWDLEDSASQLLIRTAGWVVKNTAGSVIKEFMCAIGLGSVENDDQVYAEQVAGTPVDFALAGQVNQAFQTVDDPNGDGNYVDGYDRRALFNIRVREQGQIFGSSSLTDIGVTTMGPIAYRFPLSTATDLDIANLDSAIDSTPGDGAPDQAPYSGMSITYEDTTQSRSGLTGGSFNFGITIDGNGQSLQLVYEFVQYMLRQNADINAGSPTAVDGKTADELMYWVGPTAYTQLAYNPDIDANVGVFITNFDANDQNSIIFVDDTGTERSYPFIATLDLNFNDNLVNDASAEYWVYHTTLDVAARQVSDAAITTATTTLTSATAAFVAADVDALVAVAGAGAGGADLIARIASITNGTTVELDTAAGTTVSGATLDIFGGDWGERGALLIDDDVGADMTGLVTAATITETFDYDANTQGGRTAATDAPFTAVAIGLDTGQYVRATGTIARNKTNSVTLVAPLERNYENPV